MLRCFGAAAAAAVLVADCGGGGGSSNSAPPPAPAQNQVAVTVARGVSGMPNIVTTSVTICVHGTTTCQTIDNVQVDTESFGLRLASDAISSQVLNSLPMETTGGGTLAECTLFGDGFTWGTVRTADLTIGGETASNLPIAIIGDLAASTVPISCSNAAPQPVLEATAAVLGANGILGIGVAPFDCGPNCNVASINGYYTCPNSGSCSQTAVSTTQAVTNPVARFATDNNGVILTMSAISSSTGAPSASGTLTFGIGTQSNNAMTASTQYTTRWNGDLLVPSNGAVLAFFDSGSNGYFFNDSSITPCGNNLLGFYCPATTLTRSVTVSAFTGNTTAVTTVPMQIADAASLIATGNLAFNDLGGTFPANLIDIGLPFFYGKTVFFGVDQSASGGQSPYIAF
jgi:hypothetical protein